MFFPGNQPYASGGTGLAVSRGLITVAFGVVERQEPRGAKDLD